MIGETCELRKFVAPEFVIGTDARLLAGRYARNLLARRILIVTSAPIMRMEWFGEITATLEEESIEYTVYDKVSPNPRNAEIMDGARQYTESGCDSILAIGGGSPIDCAKGIGIVATNGNDILDSEGVDRIPVPPPPMICIPTTAGTGAEVSQFAIISDRTRKVKIAIISKKIVPDIALIDPVPLLTLPQDLTAHTGMDAITHSIEAYVSNASSPVTDIHALESIRLMNTHLYPAYQEPEDPGHRYQTMLGSLCAGLAFSNASLGATHAMAHSLGGFLDLPHGECNALLLEHVITYNYPACPQRYDEIGRILGIDGISAGSGEKKERIAACIRTLRESLGMSQTLGDLGVTREDIPALAQNAIRDPCMATNPCQPTLRDIEGIYEEAL